MKSVLCHSGRILLAIGILLTGFGLPTFSASPALTPFLSPAHAAAQSQVNPIRLRFATHLPIIHHHYKNVIVRWAEEVEKRTEGRVKVTVYPAAQLGQLPEMYDLIIRGTADIAMVLPVFITGRFPLEGVFHLPLIPGDVTDPTGKVIRDMVYDKYLIPQYFRDVKMLWNGRFSLNVLQMPSKPIRKLEDIKGLVIGFAGGAVLPVVLKSWGAAPENILTNDIYTSLEKKVIDGQMIPAETLLAFRLIELVKYVTLLNSGGASHFTAMRMSAWNSLSPADQKIIHDVNTWILDRQVESWGAETEKAIQAGKKAGLEFITLTPEEKRRWNDAAKPAVQQFINQWDRMGLPATKMYNEILQLLPK